MKIRNKIFDHNNLFTRGMTSTIIKMLGAFASYILSYLIAIKYGAEGNGVFALFMTYLVILSTIFYIGLDLYLVKEISALITEHKYQNVRTIYFTILRIYLLPIGFIGFILSILFFFLFDNYIYSLIAIGLTLNIFVDLHSAVLQGMKKVEWFSYFTQFAKYLFAILFILIFAYTNDAKGILFLYVFSLFFNAVFSFFVVRYYIQNFGLPITLSKTEYSLKTIFFTSKEFFFSSILIITLVWVDFIFIDIFLPKEEAGIYSVALKIATLISFSFTAFNSFLAPRISEIHATGNISKLQKIITQNFLFTFPMILIPFLGIVIFKKDLLGFFGKEFISGMPVLIWLAVGQLINSIFGPVSLLLQMTDNQKIFQNILMLSFVIKMVSSFLLIQIWGLEGIAIASSLSLAFWTLSGSYYVNKKVGVFSWFGIVELKEVLKIRRKI